MPVVAVVNRKGGSGKSTMATHLAAYCANTGLRVMLGDVDRQQSTQAWLRRRAKHTLPTCQPITGWAVDGKSVMRPPAGITHVVLDTPGGLRGLDLARVVAWADAVLMPVGASLFDRESAAECYAELKALPRVASGRCRFAAVGMRLDPRTKAAATLALWSAQQQVPLVGVLREAQAYVRCVEQGLTLFDLPAAKVQADLDQWQAILEWLRPTLSLPVPQERPQPAAKTSVAKTPAAKTPAAPMTPSLQPPSPALGPARPRPVVPVHGDVPAGVLEGAPPRGLATRLAGLLDLWPRRRR